MPLFPRLWASFDISCQRDFEKWKETSGDLCLTESTCNCLLWWSFFTKQEIWSVTVILVASDAPAGSQGTLPVLFLWARALCKPILLHLWSEGTAFHAGRLWLLQWILHLEAVAEENNNGWSYQHQKHQEDCCALVLMLYLTRSTTLTPILLS